MEEEVLESLRSQVDRLEAEVHELEELVRAKTEKAATDAARLNARLFLQILFIPYVEGLCEGFGTTPEDGMKKLVEDEATLGDLFGTNRESMVELLSKPECRVAIAIASPVAKKDEEWLQEKSDLLLDVMGEVRPRLSEAIREIPGGPEWFAESLVGLRNILFGKPQINIETP